jgi:hypothetical protein
MIPLSQFVWQLTRSVPEKWCAGQAQPALHTIFRCTFRSFRLWCVAELDLDAHSWA